MIPKTSYRKNLRYMVREAIWDTIRKQRYQKSEYKCDKCGGRSKELHCHEVWEYDDCDEIQTLIELNSVCQMCHHIIHYGQSLILIKEGKLSENELIQHFVRVNNCTEEFFHQHVWEAKRMWSFRSLIQWQIDFGKYEKYID
ncbi:hypothetical protein A8L34_05040 [Bacillus sp. FJAT-27264]|nr:hypothetical protein A8L34_05040 [Bacillus sp. FJAT-27264]